MEHDTQPHQGDQHQLVEKEMRNHGKTPSYRWKNEGILPDLSGCRISRTLQVHDRAKMLFILPIRLIGQLAVLGAGVMGAGSCTGVGSSAAAGSGAEGGTSPSAPRWISAANRCLQACRCFW